MSLKKKTVHKTPENHPKQLQQQLFLTK